MKHYTLTAFGVLALLLSGAGCVFNNNAPEESNETVPTQEEERMEQQEEAQALQDRLREDLINRPDIIPYEGRVGGTMKVYAKDAIYFVDDGLVVASFEDGHNAGTMTLRYTIAEDGSIDWQVISSECEGCQAK